MTRIGRHERDGQPLASPPRRAAAPDDAVLFSLVADVARGVGDAPVDAALAAVVDAAIAAGFTGAALTIVSDAVPASLSVSRAMPPDAGLSGEQADHPILALVRIAGSRAVVSADDPDAPLDTVDRRGFGLLVACPVRAGGELVAVLTAAALSPTPPSAVRLAALDVLATAAAVPLLTARRASERRRFQEALARQAFHDALTKLPNRALFNDRLDHALARATRDGSVSAVLFLDLDGFKPVNDSLGHHAGDLLLTEVAERLRSSVRPMDTVARLGGDEFTVLLEHLSDPQDAAQLAQRILSQLTRPFTVGGSEVFVSASIGISYAVAGAATAEELLQEADLAMYRAKERASGSYEVFDETMHVHARERLAMETGLRRALDRGEFSLDYHPIMSVDGRGLVAVEAVPVWNEPTRGVLAGSTFLPLAEQSGLAVPLGRWVLGEACRQAAAWASVTGEGVQVCVDVTARHFFSSDFVADVASAVGAAGLDPTFLLLEISETTVTGDVERATALLDGLRHLGIGLVLDEVGSGSSSFNQLGRLPLDGVKLGRCLVGGVPHSPGDRALVRSIVGLAHDLGIRVTATGVEGGDELAEIRRLGADSAQGPYLSGPLPADAVPPLPRRWRPAPLPAASLRADALMWGAPRPPARRDAAEA